MEVELMKPEWRIEQLWDCGKRDSMRIAGSEMKEIGILAAAPVTNPTGLTRKWAGLLVSLVAGVTEY